MIFWHTPSSESVVRARWLLKWIALPALLFLAIIFFATFYILIPLIESSPRDFVG